MRTLVLVMTAVGTLLGAVEVAVTAAAETLEGASAAAPLLALWGVGSLAGGVIAARRGGGAQSAAGLAMLLAALTIGHLALVPAAGSLVGLGAMLLIAGVAIAPTYATVYAMVDDAAPAGGVTEAFAWLATAAAIGAAAGTAVAGVATEHAGASAALSLAAVAGIAALLLAMSRAHTIGGAAPVATAELAAV
jgi:predicted MFS family arabinose efflux permease